MSLDITLPSPLLEQPVQLLDWCEASPVNTSLDKMGGRSSLDVAEHALVVQHQPHSHPGPHR